MRLPRGRVSARPVAGAVGAVAALVLLLGAAAPASASDPAPAAPPVPPAAPAPPAVPPAADLSLDVTGDTVLANVTKSFLLQVHNRGPADAAGIKVTVDASGLDAAKVSYFLPDGPNCTVDGTRSVCEFGTLADGGNLDPFEALAVERVRRGKTGAAGSFTVAITADTPDPKPANNATVSVPVTVAGVGYDLQARAYDVKNYDTGAGVQPGDTAQLSWLLENTGNLPAIGVTYAISLPRYVSFAGPDEPGCLYDKARRTATCLAHDIVVLPGQLVLPDNPFQVKVAANAPGPIALTGGLVSGGALFDAPPPDVRALAAAPASASGLVVANKADVLKTDKRSLFRDANPSDDTARFTVFAGANSADLAVTAKPATGHVADTVSVKVAVANNGPADAPKTTLALKAPGGTKITAAPAGCTAVTAGLEYRCALGSLRTGEKWPGTVKLKITSATVTDGSAAVASKVADPVPANNTAPITVTVIAPSPSGSVSTSPTGGASASTPAGGKGGGLPVTGSPVALIAGGGLAAVAVGIGLLVLARRRRAAMDVPVD